MKLKTPRTERQEKKEWIQKYNPALGDHYMVLDTGFAAERASGGYAIIPSHPCRNTIMETTINSNSKIVEMGAWPGFHFNGEISLLQLHKN